MSCRTQRIEKPEPSLHGLNEEQWRELARRVGRGMAVDRDADYVEAIGLLPQAIKIRQGMATHADGILVNLQAGMRLLDIAGKLPAKQVAA